MTLARAASRSALPRCTSFLPSRWHTRWLCFLYEEPENLSNRMGQTQEDSLSLGVRRQPQEAHIEIWNRVNLRREGEILSHCLALLGSIWSVALAPVLQCCGKPSPTSIRRMNLPRTNSKNSPRHTVSYWFPGFPGGPPGARLLVCFSFVLEYRSVNHLSAFSEFLQPSSTFFSLLRLSSAFSDLPRLSTRLVLGRTPFMCSTSGYERPNDAMPESTSRTMPLGRST